MEYGPEKIEVGWYTTLRTRRIRLRDRAIPGGGVGPHVSIYPLSRSRKRGQTITLQEWLERDKGIEPITVWFQTNWVKPESRSQKNCGGAGETRTPDARLHSIWWPHRFASALPAELRHHFKEKVWMGKEGIEPSTSGVSIQRTTNCATSP